MHRLRVGNFNDVAGMLEQGVLDCRRPSILGVVVFPAVTAGMIPSGGQMAIDSGKRQFVFALGGAAVAWPLAALAQRSSPIQTIGVIMNYPEADTEGQTRFFALRDRLHKLGWMEGSNVGIEVRWAAGEADRVQAYANELVGLPADVIIANSTPSLAVLKRLTRTIPIVFVQVADPVGSGFVTSYAQPGGNITGFTDFEASTAGKWIEVLKEATPFVNRVTVLMDPDQSNHAVFLRVITSAAASFKMEVSATAVRNRKEIETAVTELAGQTDRGLVVLPGPTNNTLRDAIIRLAANYRLPAVYPFKYYVKDGGLLYYGSDQLDQWPNAANYVDRILRGAKPSELPVQAPTKYELTINLKTAKALGLDVPPSLLARADQVIE
jgi:putative ABC transport system substrate-binding protein